MNKAPSMPGCPGLKWRRRKTGWEARWQCRDDIKKRGFRPKLQRLWFGVFGTEPTELEISYAADICTRLQSEMLVWGRSGLPEAGAYDGTIGSLIDCYLTDADSPYHKKLRYATRCFYDTLCDRLRKDMGERRLSDIKPRDVLRWNENIGKVPMAHALIGMLRTLLSFGATLLEDTECTRLSMLLSKMRFPMGKPRNERLTAEQANLIRKGAHADGRPSIALAQAFQFELMLRQKDVIGEWLPMSEPEFSALLFGSHKWVRGITWNELDANMVLRHVTSKRQKLIEVNLLNAPMVVEELTRQFGWNGDRAKLPMAGPIIVREGHEVPWAEDEFRRHWRLIARRVGIPDAVRNMDSRAGAISESTDAGANLDHVRQFATHSDIGMTQRYSRGASEKVEVVQLQRIAHRNKSGL